VCAQTEQSYHEKTNIYGFKGTKCKKADPVHSGRKEGWKKHVFCGGGPGKRTKTTTRWEGNKR